MAAPRPRDHPWEVPNLRKKLPCLLLAGLMLLGLSGCFLLPAEEQLPTLPLLDPEEAPEYDYAYVTRGDLVHEETLSCTVVARQEESLSYPVTGETIQTVYVTAGDTVRAGDLIAELAAPEVDRQLQEASRQLATAREELDWARRDLEVCREAESLADQARQYQDQIQTLTDEITVLELRLSELEAQKEAGRLYCSIDGVVTYAKASGSVSIKNTTVATVASRAQSEYYTDTAWFASLPLDTEVLLHVDGAEYTARVTGQEDAPESAYRSRNGREAGEQKRVYLTVTDDRAEEIDPSKRGQFTLVIDSREDVLILPSAAVIYAGDQALVYQLEESSGLMQVHSVTVGLRVGSQIEITGGLAEGDQVILD